MWTSSRPFVATARGIWSADAAGPSGCPKAAEWPSRAQRGVARQACEIRRSPEHATHALSWVLLKGWLECLLAAHDVAARIS